MAWNNYPIYVVKAFLKRQLKDKPEKQPKPHDLIKIYLKVLYLGKQGEQLVTILVSKLHRYLKLNVKLIKFFNTKKASTICPTKDKVTKEMSYIKLFVLAAITSMWVKPIIALGFA